MLQTWKQLAHFRWDPKGIMTAEAIFNECMHKHTPHSTLNPQNIKSFGFKGAYL